MKIVTMFYVYCFTFKRRGWNCLNNITDLVGVLLYKIKKLSFAFIPVLCLKRTFANIDAVVLID